MFPKYKSWCRFVKKHYPIKIQRRRVNKKCYGWYLNGLIAVDRNADEDLAIWVVIHELGHHLSAGKEKTDHDRAFAVGYWEAYNLYLKWATEKK
jgi:Zn-dependent peptidase ImmA (M78 family)